MQIEHRTLERIVEVFAKRKRSSRNRKSRSPLYGWPNQSDAIAGRPRHIVQSERESPDWGARSARGERNQQFKTAIWERLWQLDRLLPEARGRFEALGSHANETVRAAMDEGLCAAGGSWLGRGLLSAGQGTES